MRDSNRAILSYLAYPALAGAVSAILGGSEKGRWFWGALWFLVGIRLCFFLWDWCCDWIVWKYADRPKIVSRYFEIFRARNFPDAYGINYPFSDGILGLLGTLASDNGYRQYSVNDKEGVHIVLHDELRDFIKAMKAQIVLDTSYMSITQAARYLEAIKAAHAGYLAERYYEKRKREFEAYEAYVREKLRKDSVTQL